MVLSGVVCSYHIVGFKHINSKIVQWTLRWKSLQIWNVQNMDCNMCRLYRDHLQQNCQSRLSETFCSLFLLCAEGCHRGRYQSPCWNHQGTLHLHHRGGGEAGWGDLFRCGSKPCWRRHCRYQRESCWWDGPSTLIILSNCFGIKPVVSFLNTTHATRRCSRSPTGSQNPQCGRGLLRGAVGSPCVWWWTTSSW